MQHCTGAVTCPADTSEAYRRSYVECEWLKNHWLKGEQKLPLRVKATGSVLIAAALAIVVEGMRPPSTTRFL